MRFILPALAGAIAFSDVVHAHCMPLPSLLHILLTYPSPVDIFNPERCCHCPYQYVRQNNNANSPVTDVTSDDIRCNAGGLTTSTASVSAGDTVGFALDQAIFHPGPINVYLSKASSTAASYDGSGDWFKISEIGATITSSAISWPASDIS